MSNEAQRRHAEACRQRFASIVEEDKVELEAHAERVDGGAAGNQQPGADLIAV